LGDKQSHSGLDILRETYTKKSGIDWKEATLDTVFETLGWCHDMYKNGQILVCGNSFENKYRQDITRQSSTQSCVLENLKVFKLSLPKSPKQ